MPYLHWETDRRRSRVDEIIRNLTEEHKKKEHDEEEKKKLARDRAKAAADAKERKPKGKATSSSQPISEQKTKKIRFWQAHKSEDTTICERPLTNESTPASFKPMHTLTEVIDEKLKETKSRPLALKKAKEAEKKRPRMLMPCKVLGQVLFRAAVLSEAMEHHFDKVLLREYLHSTPPLHPRRTLDQSYYWTLKTTKKRDRDQVVYRGTAPQKEFMHHHSCDKAKKEACDHRHCDWTPGCNQCQHDIRRVGRVVMVDQLWLWILDASMSHQLFVLQVSSFY
jgi:hypothetical protein